MKIHFSKTYPYINDENINVNDMTSLKEINEIDILNNLTNRFIE
jgi:myosin heavy subunit